MYKLVNLASKISTDSPRNILFSKKRLTLLIPSLGILCISIPILASLQFSSMPIWNYHPYDGELIYEDQIAGYYGYGDGSHTCVQVTNNIDLQLLLTQAQACGYNVTYRRARGGIVHIGGSPRSYEEFCRLSRSSKKFDVRYNAAGNETFDYAVPTRASLDRDYRAPEDWFKSRLHEFFPQLTDKECSDFAKLLASTYNSVSISGSPDWEAIKRYCGALSYLSCVPIDGIYEHYSNGRIEYSTPSVTIKQEIVLERDKSVVFTVSANGQGFVTINVNSKYLLNENWIREVFAKIFLDLDLPVDGLSKFTTTENWIGHLL